MKAAKPAKCSPHAFGCQDRDTGREDRSDMVLPGAHVFSVHCLNITLYKHSATILTPWHSWAAPLHKHHVDMSSKRPECLTLGLSSARTSQIEIVEV